MGSPCLCTLAVDQVLAIAPTICYLSHDGLMIISHAAQAGGGVDWVPTQDAEAGAEFIWVPGTYQCWLGIHYQSGWASWVVRLVGAKAEKHPGS